MGKLMRRREKSEIYCAEEFEILIDVRTSS
jgi:hypothetical protein